METLKQSILNRVHVYRNLKRYGIHPVHKNTLLHNINKMRQELASKK